MKKENKKEIHLNGKLLRTLSIGEGAFIHAGGTYYHTSRVVAIHEQTDEHVHFETLNSTYHLTLCPFPWAAISPLPVSLAACA